MLLPNVKQTMEVAKFNFVVSGFKSPEGKAQNFDPDVVAEKFISLMQELPISTAAFSLAIGGIAFFVSYYFNLLRTQPAIFFAVLATSSLLVSMILILAF